MTMSRAKTHRVLAFDFGASSGRAILGVLEEGRLSYREVNRFENQPLTHQEGETTTLFWDFDHLLEQVKQSIAQAGPVDSLSFDTWGLDFGLLDEAGKLLQNPVHYRDQRTVGVCEEVRAVLTDEELYEQTGIQVQPFHTLFQLLAVKKQQPGLLQQAKRLLFMPDLFAYHLSKTVSCDQTIASTSQMLDPRTGQWATALLEQLELPLELLPTPTQPGKIVGAYQGIQVISGAGHDTQCAIAAMPTRDDDQAVAFLSCGTWSILGCELDHSILTAESLSHHFSHERGANGKINYLQNISGLWLIQESRRAWRRAGQQEDYASLEEQARAAEPFLCLIDVDDPAFATFGDLPERIQAFCRRTGQVVPQTVGAIMRCIYESLAMKYRQSLSLLEQMTGQSFERLHLLGGGVKDRLLCQMTANSTQIQVTAGPVEATALGNIMMQLIALGALEQVQQGRDLIRETETLVTYHPCDEATWETAFLHYQAVLARNAKQM